MCVCVYVCMRMKRLKFRKRSYVEDPALSHPYPPLLPPLSRTHTREAHTRWIRSGSQFVKSTQNWPRFREVVRFQGHMKRHIIFPAFFFLFSKKFFLPQPPPVHGSCMLCMCMYIIVPSVCRIIVVFGAIARFPSKSQNTSKKSLTNLVVISHSLKPVRDSLSLHRMCMYTIVPSLSHTYTYTYITCIQLYPHCRSTSFEYRHVRFIYTYIKKQGSKHCAECMLAFRISGNSEFVETQNF